MTSSTTHNATSSQESASGRSPFAAPAGQMIDLFGPVPVLANLSARQARDLDLLMSGTCGRPGTTSSGSAALQKSLASRLRMVADSLGSTLYKLTWKKRATPSGLSICALRASVLRTSGSDCGSWPTPTTRDWRDGGGDPLQRGGKRTLGARCLAGGLAYPDSTERQARDILTSGSSEGSEGRVDAVLNGSDIGRRGPVNGIWGAADWLLCRDGKWRPVEPGTFPLAHGAPSRVGRLRAYGNAINAEAATQFIAAYLDATS